MSSSYLEPKSLHVCYFNKKNKMTNTKTIQFKKKKKEKQVKRQMSNPFQYLTNVGVGEKKTLETATNDPLCVT